MSSYRLRDIPDFSERSFPDLKPLCNITPKESYSLNDVAEVYAKILNNDPKKVYNKLGKYFTDNGMFKPSSKSGKYEFNDLIYPIAVHMYFKKKNRKYDPNDHTLLSDNMVFEYIYYPLFKAKAFGQENVIEAYSEYRNFILKEFKKIRERVDDSYLIEFINTVIGKSTMRLSLRIMDDEDKLINLI